MRLALSLVITLWLAVTAAAFWGLAQPEVDALENSNSLRLLERAVERNDVSVEQPNSFSKLVHTSKDFGQLDPGNYRDAVLTPVQWRRVQLLLAQFVSAENQVGANVFEYEPIAGGGVRAVGFEARGFSYRNPFTRERPVAVSVNSLLDSVPGRQRWVLNSRSLTLILDDSSPFPESRLDLATLPDGRVVRAAKAFTLKWRGQSIRVSLAPRPASVAGPRASTVRLEQTTGNGSISTQQLEEHDYFIFAHDTFVASSRSSGSAGATTPLLAQKKINGRFEPLEIGGDATTPLLGGYGGGLLASVSNPEVTGVTVTLDPDLQQAAHDLLSREIDAIQQRSPLPRRRGSLTVIDSTNGRLLAQVGYSNPAAGGANTPYRRVRAARPKWASDPSTEVHMAGSTVKVLTVALGYLLFGNADAGLLPMSINDRAVQQAFHDSYGTEVGGPTLTTNGSLTQLAHRRFQEAGGPTRVTIESEVMLNRVFGVGTMTGKPPAVANQDSPTELLIPSSLTSHFDRDLANTYLQPQTSVLPMREAQSVGVFKNYSLGLQDARFTTLRLASILATVATGKSVHPYLVAGVSTTAGASAVTVPHALIDVEIPGFDLEKRIQRMMDGMHAAMHKVLEPHQGTGSFYIPGANGNAIQLYLGADDPRTPDFDERLSRKDDFGKSGTADYGKGTLFQDSAFVYQHGKYSIAVWLEQGDQGTSTSGLDLLTIRHPAHRLVGQLLHFLESRDGR